MEIDLHDCYRILELEPGATLQEVKTAYRELVKVWHPDRFVSDHSLERKAQEKLKRINLAFERIEESFSGKMESKESSSAKSRGLDAEELFSRGQSLFFGAGVAKDAGRAADFLRQSADLGFAPAQFLLGHIYFSGDGLSKSEENAAGWWLKAADQLHAEAQYSLGCLYNKGFRSGILAKAVNCAVDWKVGDSKIEAYKWLNLALTYGAGHEAGLVKESVSGYLTQGQRNEARKRACALYPNYPSTSSEKIFGVLFDSFVEEAKSPNNIDLHTFYVRTNSKTGGIASCRAATCEKAVEYLRTRFLGDTLTKTSGFFRSIGSSVRAARSGRASDDWGGVVARNLIEFPYEYLPNTFIKVRENTINHIWLNLVEE